MAGSVVRRQYERMGSMTEAPARHCSWCEVDGHTLADAHCSMCRAHPARHKVGEEGSSTALIHNLTNCLCCDHFTEVIGDCGDMPSFGHADEHPELFMASGWAMPDPRRCEHCDRGHAGCQLAARGLYGGGRASCCGDCGGPTEHPAEPTLGDRLWSLLHNGKTPAQYGDEVSRTYYAKVADAFQWDVATRLTLDAEAS